MSEERSGIVVALLPVVRGWKFVATVLFLTWLIVAAVVVAQGRRFRAEASLSTISTARALPSAAGGLAASFLGLERGGGIQLTPGVVVRIARMDGVMFEVGTGEREGRRVVDLLAEKDPGDSVPQQRLARTMREYLSGQFDIQTGLITVSVVHRDSALARDVLARLIEVVSETYRNASRAQAGQIRVAQQLRVDSAESRLRSAEEDLAQFVERNRVVSEYTLEYVRLQELDRAVQTASEVYTTALADRDAAWAKELEETPVLVVIDPPSPELPLEKRGSGLKLIMATITAVAAAWVLLVAREALRTLLLEPVPAQTALAEAVWRLPGARRLLPRLLGAGTGPDAAG